MRSIIMRVSRRKRLSFVLLTWMMLPVGQLAAQALPLESLHQVCLVGSGTEDGQTVKMNELSPDGKPTGIYEAYMKARVGEFLIQATSESTGSPSVLLGQGDTPTRIKQKGKPFRITQEQVVRVRLDTRADSICILPVALYLKGNIVHEGTQMQYAGHGVWRSPVEMNAGNVFLFSDKFFYFAFNNDDALSVKRLQNNRSGVGMPSEGFRTENIRINRGSYTVSLDMNAYTWDISAPVNEYRISAFGSSVCNGEGAEHHKGYAWMYGEQLNERFTKGESQTPFQVSGVSIGGNSTLNLLARYDEMLHDFGRYVIIGLSLGNEGIHGAADQQKIFRQFHDNMLVLIEKCRQDGKIPVVMNNYTRGDYNQDDYSYVKQMNLDIHRWEVPSVNVLGAIDNGEGKWADGYMRDTYHQDTKGHREFMLAIPPSLFDALQKGKPYPTRKKSGGLVLHKNASLQFSGEGIVHPFTVSLRLKGNKSGRILSIQTEQGEAVLSVLKGGLLQYTAQDGAKLSAAEALPSDKKVSYDITLTHYYAQQRTLIYVDERLVGELRERMVPTLFTAGDSERKSTSRLCEEISFWRSAMTQEEIALHHQGECMKSSLEIYTPLDEQTVKDGLHNLAQSMNQSLRYVP